LASELIQFNADWQPLVQSIVGEFIAKKTQNESALNFHKSLTDLIVNAAGKFHTSNIVLSGGVFQNSFLLRHIGLGMEKNQITFFTSQNFPSNDGGLSLGQAMW